LTWGKFPYELLSDPIKHLRRSNVPRQVPYQRQRYRILMDPHIAFSQHESNWGNFRQAWPRSFEELQIERSYLLNCLQREDHKATELLRNIRLLQDELGQGPELRGNKTRKRQLRYLKNRMRECTEQEKAILARLGHVTYDIQYRERLTRIENERIYHLDCYEMQQMQQMQQIQLNATCPAFIPQIIYIQQAATTDTDGVISYAGYPRQETSYENVSQRQFSNISLAPDQSSPASSSPVASRPRSASTNNLTVPMGKEKRLSMPNIRSCKIEQSFGLSGSIMG
jgi:hypothetical protein